ncbi:hypothetical protein GCM10010329_79300 [Streptomyces spiroverticillatus]|uniref:Uncharacterized protein n=1 Tax=Streptomyces finlayi TaxID=67296 RepID=A0A918X884_9ACTN|nr:hypothetical protein [Streptomyces finlayi]GHA44750.1 hypothetical protein GCM10010329_79300 [Streptomyces spiroverticillatus]GHD17968.1 hypothetical protein GCM10010334_80280 [Streptomyces finlayi]
MRAFVLYDKDGTITSAGIPAAPDTGRQALLGQPEQSVAEVELPDTPADMPATAASGHGIGEDLTEQLTRMIAEYRVDVSGQSPVLVRK